MTEIPAATEMRELTDAELDQVSGGLTFQVATPKALTPHTASDQALGLAKAGANGGAFGVIILDT